MPLESVGVGTGRGQSQGLDVKARLCLVQKPPPSWMSASVKISATCLVYSHSTFSNSRLLKLCSIVHIPPTCVCVCYRTVSLQCGFNQAQCFGQCLSNLHDTVGMTLICFRLLRIDDACIKRRGLQRKCRNRESGEEFVKGGMRNQTTRRTVRPNRL